MTFNAMEWRYINVQLQLQRQNLFYAWNGINDLEVLTLFSKIVARAEHCPCLRRIFVKWNGSLLLAAELKNLLMVGQLLTLEL